MAIEKCRFKVSRCNPEYQLPQMRDTVVCSDDENLQRGNSVSAVESDDDEDDQFDECDSGAGSDDFDLLELGQTGEEFCQVGDQTCSIPYELYDLPGFKDVLSMEVWNEVLTEEERFGLAKYLPDMDQENFVLTLKELFSCDNLDFGNPVDKLFEMLKEGSCEPRVAHYRQGLNFLQRRQHYHNIRKHQNAMVSNLCQMRDAWMNCKGYSIEEKLRVLNIKKCQKSLMNESMEKFGTDSSDKDDSGNDLWGEKAKDGKLVPKKGRFFGYSRALELDICTPGLKVVAESNKQVKKKPKGNLKVAGSKTTSAKELADHSMPILPDVEIQSRHYGLALPVHRNKAPVAAYNTSASIRMNKRLIQDNDEEDTTFAVASHRERNLSRGRAIAKSKSLKFGKKQKGSAGGSDVDSSLGLLETARSDVSALGRNSAVNLFSDINVAKPSYRRDMHDGGAKMNCPKNFQHLSLENEMEFGNNWKLNSSLKASQLELLGGSESSSLGRPLRGHFPDDSTYDHPAHMNAKSKKWTTGRKAVDLNVNDKSLQSMSRSKNLQEKFLSKLKPDGQRDVAGNADIVAFDRGEETESDSSDQMMDDDDENPLMRSKWAYPGGVPDSKYGPETKKVKLSRKDARGSYLGVDGSLKSTKKMDDYGEDLDMIKSIHKGKMHDVSYMNVLPTDYSQRNFFVGPGNIIGGDDSQLFYPLGRNGHVEGSHGNIFKSSSLKSSLVPGRKPLSEAQCNAAHLSSDYMNGYSLEDELLWTRSIAAEDGVSFKSGKKGQMVEPSTGHHAEKSGEHLVGGYTISKKRKLKDGTTNMDPKDNSDCLRDDAQLLLDGINSLRKRGKKNTLEEEFDVLEDEISEPPSVDVEMEVVEAQTKPKNKPFPLIIPTVLTGFSFSIIHLLSAVRRAMVTVFPEDIKHHDKVDDAGEGVKEEPERKQEETSAVDSTSGACIEALPSSAEQGVISRPVQEIVSLVRSNPGDPCILETQEPLQDLVRGVLKIFSSRTAPLGAKGWKPLVVYEKSTKSWSWIGPIVRNAPDSMVIEEDTSPDVWALPYKTLVKLVDSFANWLKNSQDALQQIGSLPAPPLALMQNILDEKERFKDLRAQKSLSTISPNPEEVRAYFQKEEVLRYLIPDRAFSYTAVDGKKSIVAPLRRCGGKPTSKARDHFMLKRDRPPHVTILCLVRDAAARLPGSIGTRADVCTLIRDSQYIVEDVSDAQVNQVVSGALDRLHYERDPCVQFDGERKLWVYLHRERDEEDFEDDGTSSTKKWRKQKKEPSEPSDQAGVTVAFSGPVEPSGLDVVSDLNAGASFADDSKTLDVGRHNGNDQGNNSHDPSPVTWSGLGLNSMGENELVCQENSANGDFEDTFGE
ncbi:hypothetical protein F511_23091 [Dorcoceras hygrometricum]|uniref:DEUBAD domain-containing protein n=1 Tax=Dorcoceras hygrometricum TaxID=472368 RepID=A0A2Z7AXC3_9LAMI|nr:hypothetical protein F511_23091 [Dorcoceras hygrometricum]